MDIKFKDEIKRYRWVVLTAVLCSILLTSAYALSYLWSAPTAIAITTSSPYIKVWYGSKEVTSLSFGSLVPGSHINIHLHVVNHHPNSTFYVKWGSTLSSVTDKITDAWWGTHAWILLPGGDNHADYHIYVAPDCPLGTYSWTLYVSPG